MGGFALFLHALPYGLGLSLLLTIALLAGLWINPEMLLNDYPPDVKAAYGPARNPKSKTQARLFAVLIFLLAIGALAAALINLPRPGNFGAAFWMSLVTIWSILMIFNLVDMVLIDFPLVYFKPKRLLLPGTEGMKGYADYGFHARGFLKGMIGITLVSPVLALIPAVLWVLL